MKNILIVFVFAAITSCNRPQAPINQASTNKGLVRQYFELFNQHRWQQLAGMYTPTAQFKDPSLGTGTVTQTRKQIMAKYMELGKQIPDVRDSIIKIYPSGDQQIIVEFISTGNAPDGSAFKLPVCAILTFKDGKISKDYTYYDNF